MKRRILGSRHQKATVTLAVALVLGLAAGIGSNSDAASPFDLYYNYGDGGGGQGTSLDKQGPRLTATSATKTLRLSRSGVFVYTLGPFGEDVSGSVSFGTAKAVAAKKHKLSFGTKRFKAKIGKKARIRVKLGKKARRAVRRNRKVRVRARVVVRDFIGNPTRRSFLFTLKRPR